jgi:hypothetical protein
VTARISLILQTARGHGPRLQFSRSDITTGKRRQILLPQN